MKFWEGAILVVGGIWLIGRMSRQSAMHPANRATTYAQTPPLAQQTNVASAPFVVAGENLAPPVSIPGPVKTPLTVAKSNVFPVTNNIRYLSSPAVVPYTPTNSGPNIIQKTIMTPNGPQSIRIPSYLNV